MEDDKKLAREELQRLNPKLYWQEILDMEIGHTWHHVEGGRAMELVPKDWHKAHYHYGGSHHIRKNQTWHVWGRGFEQIQKQQLKERAKWLAKKRKSKR